MANVLYVEDNPVNAKLFAAIVQRGGMHTLHIAANGKEGREILDSVSPVLVFLDLHLPDTNGFELFQMIQDRLSHQTQCYLISAEERSIMAERAIAAGFTGYIEKPINVEEILGILSAAS